MEIFIEMWTGLIKSLNLNDELNNLNLGKCNCQYKVHIKSFRVFQIVFYTFYEKIKIEMNFNY